MSEGYLLDIALILLGTKLFGIITKKFELPQVVGALIAGMLIGPAVLNIVHETDFISQIAEIGVIVLMFSAGLQSNLGQLKSMSKSLFIIALCGVLIPLAGGFTVAYFFNEGRFLQNIFIGAVLTATSVSITVETLKEMGKLSTKIANAILGAAIVDDILGIVLLTFITSISDKAVKVQFVLFKICAFFVFIFIAGYIISKVFSWWVDKYNIDKRRFVIGAFVICLILSFCAARFFGVADITGAFAAGLMLSQNSKTNYITKRIETLSYILLTPVFFANIGINITLPQVSVKIILFAIILTAVAMLTKVIGCGIGAKLSGYSNKDSISIGTGMIPRGEVALIIASKGVSLGVISNYYLAPILIMVIVTAVCAPIFIKKSFG